MAHTSTDGRAGSSASTTPRGEPGAGAYVLLVEDKVSLRAMLRLALEQHGHVVVEAADQAAALAMLAERRPAVVLTDLRLPDGDGLAVLEAVRAVDSEIPVIVMTAYGGIEDAVTAMKRGALDFVAKPVDPEHLRLLVSRALDRRRLVAENQMLRAALAPRAGAPSILGEAPSLQRVLATLRRAAATHTTVLIEGESGTGKELFARALHELSPRADGPFVAINCAAIPGPLLEAELFGYEPGAFTDAAARKLGKFEIATEGTLFLDEVAELPLGLQAKLLRVLDEQRFERLGGTESIQVDVRIVAATNRELRERVVARRFRDDLFFRLSVLPVTVPPLRDRASDIPILARHFLEKFAAELKRGGVRLSPTAVEALVTYPWPGNVRELRNCIERAIILCDQDTLERRHLGLPGVSEAPRRPHEAWAGIDTSGSLQEASQRVLRALERHKIGEALREADGDPARASDLLGLAHLALLERMKALDLGPR